MWKQQTEKSSVRAALKDQTHVKMKKSKRAFSLLSLVEFHFASPQHKTLLEDLTTTYFHFSYCIVKESWISC